MQQVLEFREQFKNMVGSLTLMRGENLKFLDLWIVGSLTPAALELLGDYLKGLLPS